MKTSRLLRRHTSMLVSKKTLEMQKHFGYTLNT